MESGSGTRSTRFWYRSLSGRGCRPRRLTGWQAVDAWRGSGGRRGAEQAAGRLAAFGVVAVVPAALAGAADWSEQHEQQMRVGLVHLLAVAAAADLYAASLAAGDPGRGRALTGLMAAALAAARAFKLGWPPTALGSHRSLAAPGSRGGRR